MVYGPLKMMAEILAEVKTECFKELRVTTMAPFLSDHQHSTTAQRFEGEAQIVVEGQGGDEAAFKLSSVVIGCCVPDFYT